MANDRRASPIARRTFVDRAVKICSSAVAAVYAAPGLLAHAAAPDARYERSRLVDTSGKALKASQLPEGKALVFTYPFTETPCFLLNLGKSVDPGHKLETKDGDTYQWQGGVGPANNIVAFSAICSHKLSHPAKTISFISYQHQKVNFSDKADASRSQGQVIFCCSERSVYDAAAGGEVLGGPAPQPLAAVVLDHNPSSDELFATGIHGADMFDRFFEKFGPRLMLEHGSDKVRVPSPSDCKAVDLNSYSRALRTCG